MPVILSLPSDRAAGHPGSAALCPPAAISGPSARPDAAVVPIAIPKFIGVKLMFQSPLFAKVAFCE